MSRPRALLVAPLVSVIQVGLRQWTRRYLAVLAFLRSAQYRFIRWETALRAAADMLRERRDTVLTARRTPCRFLGTADSSGKALSIAATSPRSRSKVTCAPVRASSRSLSGLSWLAFAIACLLQSTCVTARRYLRRSISATMPPGSTPSARATSRNSITSSRRSPLSNFETNDCGRPSLLASVTCVGPAFLRASAKSPRKCSCFLVKAAFATAAVYPNIEYPK